MTHWLTSLLERLVTLKRNLILCSEALLDKSLIKLNVFFVTVTLPHQFLLKVSQKLAHCCWAQKQGRAIIINLLVEPALQNLDGSGVEKSIIMGWIETDKWHLHAMTVSLVKCRLAGYKTRVNLIITSAACEQCTSTSTCLYTSRHCTSAQSHFLISIIIPNPWMQWIKKEIIIIIMTVSVTSSGPLYLISKPYFSLSECHLLAKHQTIWCTLISSTHWIFVFYHDHSYWWTQQSLHVPI